MAVVKRIGPVSALKIGAIMHGIAGLIVGLVASILTLVGHPLANAATRCPIMGEHCPLMGRGVGVAAIIVFPIAYAILGGIVAVLFALIYNLIAGWVGGLEVDIG